MADFELEQLKTLFDSMAQRLDETAGDVGNRKELEQIKNALRRLREDIVRKSDGNTPAENRQFINDFFKEWDRQNPLREVREAVDDLNETIEKNPLRQNTGGGGNPLRGGGGGQGPGSGAGGATGKLGKLGKAASVATGALTGIAGALGVGYNFLKDQAESYRTVLGTAEGSITSLMDMRETAAKNSMSVNDLTQALVKNENIRAMGAKEWSSFSKVLREDTRYVGMLGMNFEQMTEAQDAYLGTLRNTGNLNSMGQEEMLMHFKELIGVNQEMAGIMGKTRQEQLEAMKAESVDANFNAALDGMQLSAQDRDNIFAKLATMSETEKNAYKEIFATGGAPVTQASADFLAMGGELSSELRRQAVQDRGGNVNDAVGDTERLRQSSQNMRENAAYRRMTGILAMGGHGGAGGLNDAIQFRTQQLEAADKEDKTNADAMAKNGPGWLGVMAWEDAERSLSAAFDDNLNQALKVGFDKLGPEIMGLTEAAFDAAEALHGFARTLEENPNATFAGSMGLGALTLAGAGLAGGAGGLIGGKVLKRFVGGKAGGATQGAAGNAAKSTGTAGGAARGAGMMGRLAGVARFAGVAGGILGGGLMTYDGASDAAKSQDNWDNAKGHGQAAIGGALTGAAIGSVVPVVGTAIGAALGAAIGGGGSMLYDWFDDSDAPPKANATRSPKTRTVQKPAARKPAPADATKSSTTNEQALVRLNARIATAQEESLRNLQSIRSTTKEQLDVMREDMASTNRNLDRLARLLEEGNRNTREIRGLT